MAWTNITPLLGERQKMVFGAIRFLGNPCNQDIAEFLGWPINCITGRVKELRDKYVVIDAGLKVNRAGRMVMCWKVMSYELQD